MQHQGNAFLIQTACVATLTLPQRRYLALVDQLLDEQGGADKHGAKVAVARRLGIAGKKQNSPSHVNQLHDGTKPPGMDIIERAIERLRMRREFFYDETLRDPKYVDYIRGRERVERDDERGYPVIEEYIEQEEAAGRPVPERHKTELRKLRLAYGPDELTLVRVRAMHRAFVAEDAQKALEAPLIESEIDEARGQRPLPSIGRKRR